MIYSFIKCRNGLAAVSKAKKQGAKPIAYASNGFMGSYWVFETFEELSAWKTRQSGNPNVEFI